MVFDVLRLYGVSLVDRPLDERRATLERMELAAVPNVSLSPSYTDGRALLEATRQRGMEGVLAKRRDSPYRPGRRSPHWVKSAHQHTQVCLVGGWRPERSSAGRIGALLLGLPDGTGLRYVGKVGAGLTGATAQRVLHERLVDAGTAAVRRAGAPAGRGRRALVRAADRGRGGPPGLDGRAGGCGSRSTGGSGTTCCPSRSTTRCEPD